MQDFCELCGRDGLTLAYAPENSSRGISVYICCWCGLVQSLPRIDHAPRMPAAVSSGANWGNVRYGKGFRTTIALDALKRHTTADGLRLIDIGSNRGRFIDAAVAAFPAAEVVAVEPDERVAEAVAGKAELIVARIEALHLESGQFDVVHSCHTIEHLAHPHRTLKDHARILKPGGLLLLDAPNIAIIGADDIVEEWFIDKHLYHFSQRTLTRMVEASGFEIIESPDANDRENVFLVARKTGTPPTAPLAADPGEVDSAVALISTYGATRSHNIEALHAVAAEIAALAPRGVAMWGAGRIFDSLVVHGDFDPKHLLLLIDTHLKAHVGERFGVTLSGPEVLAGTVPGVVVVMSRGFAGEIAAEVRRLAPGAEVLLFSDLLSQARLKMAA
jgi:SAM-dependent methyltransferase